MLRQAMHELGIGFEKSQVAHFRRIAEGLSDPFAVSDETVLDQQAKKTFKGGNAQTEVLQVFPAEQQQLRIFQCVDIAIGRGFRVVAVEISNPPALDRKLDDMFTAFFIDGVVAQTALTDKSDIPADLSGLQQERSARYITGSKISSSGTEFILTQGYLGQDILTKTVE